MTKTNESVSASNAQSFRSEDEEEVNLLDLLQVVVDNMRLLVLGPLIAGSLALGISFFIAPTFTATTKFLPPQQAQSSAATMLASLGGALGGLAGAATGIKNPNDQFVAFLQSNAVEDALIKRFKLVDRYEVEYLQDARQILESNSQITSGKDGLITVDVNDRDPAFAADVANAYVQELGTLIRRLALTEAQQRRVFFERQLSDTKTKLTQAEQALQASGVNSSALKSNPIAAITLSAQIQAQIAAQEVKLASMRGYLTDAAPDFKLAQAELAALKAQRNKAEQSDVANIKNGDADYVARFREFKYFETLFEMFAKQYEIARIDESREGSAIQIIDVATPPERKSKPKKSSIALVTTLASGGVLLLFVFIRQSMHQSKQTPETAARFARLSLAWRKALGRS